MSAFVVHPDHIDLLVSASQRWNALDHAYADQPEPDDIGAILLAQNIRSVNHRYSTTDTAPAYTWRPVNDERYTATEVIKACHCYDYQACETDDYQTTEAAKIVRAILSAAIYALPGYRAAAWTWTRPAAAANDADGMDTYPHGIPVPSR